MNQFRLATIADDVIKEVEGECTCRGKEGQKQMSMSGALSASNPRVVPPPDPLYPVELDAQ